MKYLALLGLISLLLFACYVEPYPGGDGDGDGDSDIDYCDPPVGVQHCVWGISSSNCTADMQLAIDDIMFAEVCAVDVFANAVCGGFSFTFDEQEDDGCYVGIFCDGTLYDGWLTGEATVVIDCGSTQCDVTYPMLF